jgi:hypothetical protein
MSRHTNETSNGLIAIVQMMEPFMDYPPDEHPITTEQKEQFFNSIPQYVPTDQFVKLFLLNTPRQIVCKYVGFMKLNSWGRV